MPIGLVQCMSLNFRDWSVLPVLVVWVGGANVA